MTGVSPLLSWTAGLHPCLTSSSAISTLYCIAAVFGVLCTFNAWSTVSLTYWYDMRSSFNVRSKADISQLNLLHGAKKAEKRKTKNRKCLEVSVSSPGNPWSQSWKRKGRLRWEGFAEKEGFKPGMIGWRTDGWWKWWVDGTDGGSDTQRTGWVRIGKISAWLMERSRELIQETRGSILEGRWKMVWHTNKLTISKHWTYLWQGYHYKDLMLAERVLQAA